MGDEKGTSQSGPEDDEKPYVQMQEIRTKILVELRLHIFFFSITMNYGVHFLFTSRHPPCNFYRKVVTLLMLKNTFISLTKKKFFPHLYGFFFPCFGQHHFYLEVGKF